MAWSHTQKISGHRHNNLPLCPMKDSWSWSHMSIRTTDENYARDSCQSFQKKQWEGKEEKKQELGEDLSIVCWTSSHKLARYTGFLAIGLVKLEIKIFQFVTWSHVSHMIKGLCDFKDLIFNCYLAAPQPTLGHYQGYSLNHLILITVLFTFRTKGYCEPHNKVGYLSPTNCLVWFKPRTFHSITIP